MDVAEDQTAPKQRQVTVAEAARLLDMSAEAIRSRIKRGTLESIKEGATVYVILEADQTSPEQPPKHDQPPSDITALISELREHNATLREQLAAERRANEENRRLLAALIQRVPELEAPSEPSERPETATEEPEGAEPRPGTGGPQEPVQEERRYSRWVTVVMAALLVAAIAIIVVGWLTGFFSFLY
jgi:hypothetical protein